MEKVWYIKINGKPEGPYSVLDLKRDWRLTPDILVWREGFSRWIPMRHVVELKEVFEDEKKPAAVDEETPLPPNTNKEEIALDLRSDPPNSFWILIFTIILIYFFIQLLWFR